MAYITVSAGWCANHLAARLFDELEGEFLDEQERPRLALIDRKGAAKLHTFDSQPVETEEKEDEENEDEKLAEGVYGWDGEVEIHRQETSTPYGWSRYWKNKWNSLKTSRTYLTTLSDMHKAEPPELTGYVEGYERLSEARYLDEIEENIRQMAEDVDHLEGFNTMSDCFDGFSGVSTKLHEFLNDEYNRSSVLFSIAAPWEKRTPYSILNQAMSLLTPSKLNIPLCGGGADVDAQTDRLLAPVNRILSSFSQRPLSYLTSFLLPRRMNILSLYTSVPSMDSIFHYLYEAKPYKDEVCLNWTSSNSSYATYSSLSVLHGPSTYVNKIRPDSNNSKNPYIKREADAAEALSLWHFDHCRSVTDSVVVESEERTLDCLRNSNQVHEWLKSNLPLLGRFSSKLTRMEDDDWFEKLEELKTLADSTRSRNQYESESDTSSDSE